MISLLRTIWKNLPTFLLALVVAVAAWISAVTASDPTVERTYDRVVPVEIIGQDPTTILTSDLPDQINFTLSAPTSIWELLSSEQKPIRALVDLSGLGPGTHIVDIQPQISVKPVRLVSYSPRSIEITLEEVASKSMPLTVVKRGDVAIGYIADAPTLSNSTITISGPVSLVEQVADVRIVLDQSNAQSTINRSLTVQAVDANEVPVSGLTISPDKVTVNQVITQRGGFRNVVVKVIISQNVPTGYRLTNITVSPPAVTVFSSDPRLVNELPGYVETTPLDLSQSKDDFEIPLALNLPAGISVVGDQTVQVQVGIAAIEGSITLTRLKVNVIGLADNLAGTISPETVDVIISGPLALIDALTTEDIILTVDLTGVGRGTYQRPVIVKLTVADLFVESILPESVEIVVGPAPTPTPTPRVKP